MLFGSIYIIHNTVSDTVYVGQSLNYERRWKSHKFDLRNNKHNNKHMQHAWDKYGESSFEFDNIEDIYRDDIITLKEDLTSYEESWILFFKQMGFRLYNCANPRKTRLVSPKCSEDTKKKISKTLTGRESSSKGIKRSQETRDRISNSKVGRTHVGVPHTEESIEKMRQSKLGSKHTKETCDKMSRQRKGMTSPMKGRRWSETTRLKRQQNISVRKSERELASSLLVE